MSEPRPDDWSSDDWATPPEEVARWAEQFGPFDLDPCCRPETAKAPCFYTVADDGLALSWFGRVWLNPPYSNPGPWLKKAKEEVATGNCELVTALIPAATDTAWFHDHVLHNATLHFRRGRIRFLGWMGTPIGSPKSPSIIAVYA